MTLEDLLLARDAAEAAWRAEGANGEKFRAVCKAEQAASFAMARLDIGVARIGATFYERYANGLTVRRDVPEASTIPVADD